MKKISRDRRNEWAPTYDGSYSRSTSVCVYALKKNGKEIIIFELVEKIKQNITNSFNINELNKLTFLTFENW